MFWGTGRTTEAYRCWVCPWGHVWGAPIIHRASLTESQASPKVTGNFQTPNTEVFVFQQGFKFVPSLCGAAGCQQVGVGAGKAGHTSHPAGLCLRALLAVRTPGGSSSEQQREGFQPVLPIAFFFQHLCNTNTQTGLRPGIRNHLSILAAGYPALISSCAFCMKVSISITFQVKLTICFSLCVCAILCACRHSSGRL